MKLLLIRHGDPFYAIDSLTRKGWREAELLGVRLEKEHIDQYYVSPHGRACDTASPTLRRKKATAEVLPWLREYCAKVTDPHDGKTRIPWNLFPEDWTASEKLFDKDAWFEDEIMRSGNTLEIQQETVNGLDALLLKNGLKRRENSILYDRTGDHDVTIALFCHFGISMVMLAHLLGLSPIQCMHVFFTAPSSVTTLVTEERHRGTVVFRCTAVGDVSHLYAAGEPASPAGLFPAVNNTDGLAEEYLPILP